MCVYICTCSLCMHMCMYLHLEAKIDVGCLLCLFSLRFETGAHPGAQARPAGQQTLSTELAFSPAPVVFFGLVLRKGLDIPPWIGSNFLPSCISIPRSGFTVVHHHARAMLPQDVIQSKLGGACPTRNECLCKGSSRNTGPRTLNIFNEILK